MAVKMAVPHDFLLGKLVILLRVFVRSADLQESCGTFEDFGKSHDLD